MLKVRRWLKQPTFSFVCAVVLLGIGLSTILAQHTLNANERVSPRTQPLSAATPLTIRPISSAPIVPILESMAADLDLDVRKVALGKQLFHETKLSGNNQISCASCHHNDLGGADGRAKSIGINNQLTAFNAPTVWNSSLNFRQFWDGRAATLEAQINGPILNPVEMDSSWQEIISKLSQDDQYISSFSKLYPAGITAGTIREAIATYERSLMTPNARFDQYLQGDATAITAAEKAGYQRFKDYGCVACHQGINIGGNMFQQLGVMRDFFIDRGNIQPTDLGRMNITGRVQDRYVFKVPSLRNVALTAPYLHDGSIETLEETIDIMGQYQLGRHIPEEDIALLVKFLRTLTGELTDEASPVTDIKTRNIKVRNIKTEEIEGAAL